VLAKLPERRLRLAFFGTPELARTILSAIIEAKDDDVVLVVCQPDKPKGRGQKLEPPPVKELALAKNIPIIQPEKMKDGRVRAALEEAKIDLAIVAAFGRILPQDVLDVPRFGCWNVHASLLPRHRGASPIQHAILAGDRESGVTLMQMTAGLDEGPMLLRIAFVLAEDETTATLTARVEKTGSDLVIEGLRVAKEAGLDVTPQDASKMTLAPLIQKEEGRLDLSKPGKELERRVRALNPWPGTWIDLPSGEALRVLRARLVPGDASPAGSVLGTGASLKVQTGEGALEILEVQPPGKRPMAAADFLRGAGRSLTIGAHLLQR
jgi:methionyl-tRNA formyltransferase